MLRLRQNALAALVLLIAPAAYSQPPAPLKFEVASIRPTSTEEHELMGIRPAPGGERYIATNATLRLMISVAYRLKFDQITKGPSWIDAEHFDMNAKAEHPSSTEELHAMLQDLIADRFKLQFHKEKKDLPIYALTVDKGGPKLQAHRASNAGEPWIDVQFEQTMKWHAKFAPMDYFAWRLGLMLDRPVVDQTNLKGGYDFDLAFTPERQRLGSDAPAATLDNSGPTIFDAVREQLGLKLERKKGRSRLWSSTVSRSLRTIDGGCGGITA